jgi:hypothetical protein
MKITDKSLNEHRQVKDSVYNHPKVEVYNVIEINTQYIIDLIKKYPNDQQLGNEIRKYYLQLKND